MIIKILGIALEGGGPGKYKKWKSGKYKHDIGDFGIFPLFQVPSLAPLEGDPRSELVTISISEDIIMVLDVVIGP